MFCEKFKPKNFKDLVCNEDSVFMLYKILKKIGIFNLLISSSSGLGKNSLFFSFLNELSFQPHNYELIELFGINDNKIKNTKEFIADCLENNFSKNIKKKIIIIKDLDFLPFHNQLYLRKYLENFSFSYNFWLISKSIFTINTGISSRCVRIILKKQGNIQISVRIKEIFDKENITLCLETTERFIGLGNFNFRVIYNFLIKIYIFNYARQIKSLTIQENFTSTYKKNFCKEYFLRDKNYEYIKKIFKNKFKFSYHEPKFWNSYTSWFFLNNITMVFE